MKRIFALLVLCLAAFSAQATTYYIKACGVGASAGCDDTAASDAHTTTQAQSLSTPWKSFAPLTTTVFNALPAGSKICVVAGSAVTTTGQGGDYQNLNATKASPITYDSCVDTVTGGGWLTNTDSGTSTAIGALTLADSTKSWTTNAWAGYSVRFAMSDGQQEDVEIVSNTATVLTLAPFMPGETRAWVRRTQDMPSVVSYTLQAKRGIINNLTFAGATFQLFDSGTWNHDEGYVFKNLDLRAGFHDTGTATGATAGPPGTITDSSKSWTTDQWVGYKVNILTGTITTGLNDTCTVASNTATVITCTAAWSGTSGTPVAGDKYYLDRGVSYGFVSGNEVHWVTFDNMRFEGFGIGVNWSASAFNGAGSGGTDGLSRHAVIKHSQFISNHQGVGGGGYDLLTEGNLFARNSMQQTFDHTIYNFSATVITTHMDTTQQIGRHNYLIDNSVGVPGTCQSVIWTTHGDKTGYTIDDNSLIETVQASNGNCRGIEISSGAYGFPEGFDMSFVRRNRIIGIYNVGIGFSNAHKVFVESNEIYSDGGSGFACVLITPQYASPATNTSAGNYQLQEVKVRNNSCYIKNPLSTTYAYGIRKNAADVNGFGNEFVNNYAYLGAGATTSTVCWNRTNMVDAEWDVWDNNLCFAEGGVTPKWTEAYSTRSAYNTATGFDAHSLTTQPTFAGTPSLTSISLAPASGSPVNGAGHTSVFGHIAIDGCAQTSPPSIGAAPYRASSCNRAPSAPWSIH